MPSQRQGLTGFHISLAPFPQALAEAPEKEAVSCCSAARRSQDVPPPPGNWVLGGERTISSCGYTGVRRLMRLFE